MDTIEEKTESINKQFLNTMLEDTISNTEILKLISAFSFFISKTNKNYKYNLTYLQSYVPDFIHIKEEIKRKNQYINIIGDQIKELCNKVNAEYIFLTIDDFWIISCNKYQNRNKDILKLKYDLSEIINKEKIISDKLAIELKITFKNLETMCVCHIIKLASKSEKQINIEISEIVKEIINLKDEAL